MSGNKPVNNKHDKEGNKKRKTKEEENKMLIKGEKEKGEIGQKVPKPTKERSNYQMRTRLSYNGSKEIITKKKADAFAHQI